MSSVLCYKHKQHLTEMCFHIERHNGTIDQRVTIAVTST